MPDRSTPTIASRRCRGEHEHPGRPSSAPASWETSASMISQTITATLSRNTSACSPCNTARAASRAVRLVSAIVVFPFVGTWSSDDHERHGGQNHLSAQLHHNYRLHQLLAVALDG
jgi:hypothetical protein